MKKKILILVLVCGLLVLFSDGCSGKIHQAERDKRPRNHPPDKSDAPNFKHKIRPKQLKELFLFDDDNPNSLAKTPSVRGEARTTADSPANTLARKRILHDKRHRLGRRKRYSAIVVSGGYQPSNCPGWITYNPHSYYQPPCCRRYPSPCSQDVNRYSYVPYVPMQPVPSYTSKPSTTPASVIQIQPPIKQPAQMPHAWSDWLGLKYGCNCTTRGSKIATCGIVDGNCQCKPHYIGKYCDRCEDGYWENSSGCVKCQCNQDYTNTTVCEQSTGRCYCKSGIGGDKCDTCLPGHFSFSTTGCKRCDPCGEPGHICDPDTGRCVCPPHSYGSRCSKCLANTWGNEPGKGCKPCSCSLEGSLSAQCDLATGECVCRHGYNGTRCEKCSHGYYGYPMCRSCSCFPAGTDRDRGNCDPNGVCQCDASGQCPCKENVKGRSCNACKSGTFGLHSENPNGCTTCFCFKRSTECEEARLTWDQIRTDCTRVLTKQTTKKRTHHNQGIVNDTIVGSCSNISVSPSELHRRRHRNMPLYWQLHETFRGDHILSYGGYIRFKTELNGTNHPRQHNSIAGPLVKLQGNGLELHHYQDLSFPVGKYEVRLHESLWKNSADYGEVTRENLMIVLQNVTNILVKATDSLNFNQLTMHKVTLDTATKVPGDPPPLAMTVERCHCMKPYSGSSCQNPSTGFFRDRPKYPVSNNIDGIIGHSVPCKCNGRSNICDTETGQCLNCTDYTDGFHCEKCAEGFYGNPMKRNGVCKPCPCPTPEQNFAIGCSPKQGFTCICKPGYIGEKCNQCTEGYFGNPHEVGGKCQPCDCNKEGISAEGCDIKTGQCFCKLGITGRKCSECKADRHILVHNDCTPCDNCTQELLNRLDEMAGWLQHNITALASDATKLPWDALTQLQQKFVLLENKYNLAQIANKTTHDYYDSKVEECKKKTEELYREFEPMQEQLEEELKKMEQIRSESGVIEKKVDQIKKNLKGLINTLKNFGKTHISTNEAVRKGTVLLEHIRQSRKKMNALKDSDAVLKKCNAVQKVLQDMSLQNFTNYMTIYTDKYVMLDKAFSDLYGIITNVSHTVTETGKSNRENEDGIEKLKQKINSFDVQNINSEIYRKKILINRTTQLLENVTVKFNEFDEGLDERLNKLRAKEEELNHILRKAKKYSKKVTEHANNLNATITYNINKLKWEINQLDAVNASQRYSNIIALLEEANATANEAKAIIDEVHRDFIDPKSKDSLSVNATVTEKSSDSLRIRINNIRQQIVDLTSDLRDIELEINKIKDKNWDNGVKNGQQTKQIFKLKNIPNYMANVEKIVQDANNVSETMKEVYRKAGDIHIRTQYDLRKKFDYYSNLTSKHSLAKMRDAISNTNRDLQNIYYSNKTMDVKNSSDFSKALNGKLKELRDKIQLYKQKMSHISVPLTGRSCSRTYRLNDLTSSLITTLNVRFKYGNKSDSSLFYLSNGDQFMNLKIVDGGLRFELKLTDKLYNITETKLGEEDNEVCIKRLGNYVEMKVNEETPKNITMTGIKSMFGITSDDLVHVGSAENITGLPACLEGIVLNGRGIGLWNFEKSNGTCDGCESHVRFNSDLSNINLIGDGYLKYNKSNHRTIAFTFYLATFDENAIIMAVNLNGTFIALTLKDGRIQYEYRHKHKDEIILTTEQKYNNGDKIKIDVIPQYLEMGKEILQVTINNEQLKNKRPASKSDRLVVKRMAFYFGGVPSDFFLHCSNCSLHTTTSLLGYIKNPQDDGNDMDLQHNLPYYSQLQDDKLQYKNAWFEGNGYIELEAVISPNITFILRTTQVNAFIMSVGNMVNFTIKDGQISVDTFNNATLTSSKNISDDDSHIIVLERTARYYNLYVDGKLENHLASKTDNSLDDSDQKILIGGDSFDGEIRDIFINDRPVSFNRHTVRSLKNVKIGRSKPKAVLRPVLKTNDAENINSKMQATDSCDKNNNYSLELNAAKFGDGHESSYVMYNWTQSVWKENFRIEFEFRTFDSNGMLLFTQNGKHYNLLEVREGKIKLQIRGKRKKPFPPLIFPKRVSDGEWHKIVIEGKANKRKRKLAVTIDGHREKPKKIPQNRVSGLVYIGYIPAHIRNRNMENITSQINQFRGCIREFKLNDAHQGFENYNKIGQCFPKIEEGSYFNGDAYAVYRNLASPNNQLELNFEFRTTEYNGILLSVFTAHNSPALSLELQNGAVVLTVNMVSSKNVNVTNPLPDNALCNKWHNVTALISKELTVNVDGVRKSWVMLDTDDMEELDGPLYIGGIPENASGGMLDIRENFKGCMRNINVGGETVDWIKMDELNNISLNSCPIV